MRKKWHGNKNEYSIIRYQGNGKQWASDPEIPGRGPRPLPPRTPVDTGVGGVSRAVRRLA